MKFIDSTHETANFTSLSINFLTKMYEFLYLTEQKLNVIIRKAKICPKNINQTAVDKNIQISYTKKI